MKLRVAPALVATLIACLVFLQSFSLLGPAASAWPQGAGAHAVAQRAASHCLDAQTPGIPARQHHDHSDCCVFCSGGNRDASADVVAILVSFVIFFAPRTDGSVRVVIRHDLVPRPIGWASSWSSRAPPARA